MWAENALKLTIRAAVFQKFPEGTTPGPRAGGDTPSVMLVLGLKTKIFWPWP
jgi:hypothetical protein